MRITISADLTEEQCIILAKEKGWNDTIIDTSNGFNSTASEQVLIQNPIYPIDFLKNVYENMIKEDAKKLFIAYDDRINIDKKIAREQLLKDMVDAAFVN